MKVLFFLENYYPKIGGVETLFKALAEALAAKGHYVRVITTRPSRQIPTKEWVNGVEIIRLAFNNRYLFTLFSIFPALKYVRNAELIHTTSYNAALPAFLAGAIFRKKVSVTFHEVWGKLWFELPFMSLPVKFLHFLFEQLLLKLPFSAFIPVSAFTLKRLVENKVSPKRVHMIYNGINYADFISVKPITPQKTQPFTFTYFGRLGMSKGIDLLLQAFEKHHASFPKCRLQLIIPDERGPITKEIRKAQKQYPNEQPISIIHHLPFADLLNRLSQSDCIVIPSYSEGFCFAAVESIAIGTPVISSDQGALKEVVSGKFIKMNSFSADSLIEAMSKAQQGEWSTSPLKKFPLSRTVNEYELFFQSLLDTK